LIIRNACRLGSAFNTRSRVSKKAARCAMYGRKIRRYRRSGKFAIATTRLQPLRYRQFGKRVRPAYEATTGSPKWYENNVGQIQDLDDRATCAAGPSISIAKPCRCSRCPPVTVVHGYIKRNFSWPVEPGGQGNSHCRYFSDRRTERQAPG